MKRTRWLLTNILALAAWLTPGASVHGQAAPPSAPAGRDAVPAETIAQFTVPHRRVVIGDGRTINLHCMGTGRHTIMFDAGGSDWSVVWALVQPRVAGRARACSYDRAGLGYSDPAPGARSPAAIVEDLHALIAAAGLDRPLVLVGHSLGGFNVKLHAALYPDDVAGLVLVDPSEERSAERVRAPLVKRYGAPLAARIELADNDGLRALLTRYEGCAAAAKSGDLDPGSITYRHCSDPVRAQLGPAVAAERARLQVRPAYQEAQASEILNSIYGRSDGDALYRDLFRPGMLGSKPLVVLTHGRHDASDPIDAAGFESWLWLHRETAALSRIGSQRVVPDTNHNIQIEDPQAIVTAVFEILDRLDRQQR